MSFSDSKNSVALLSRPDWDHWYKQIRLLARNRNVWEYLDPMNDIPRTAPPRPNYPREDDFPDNRAAFNQAVSNYYDGNRDYNDYRKGVTAVETKIHDSIGRYAQVLIEEKTTAREMLLALKEYYQPTSKEKERDVQERFKKLIQPNKSMNIDKWVEEWMIAYHDAKNTDFNELKKDDNACLNFLRAIERTFPKFATSRISYFYDNENHDMKKLNEAFARWRIDHGKSESGSTFSVYKGEKDDGTTKQLTKKDCLCGEKHSFAECPYVSENRRPAGWQPDPAKQRKFENIRSSKLYQAVRRAREQGAITHPAPSTGSGTKIAMMATGVNSGYELANSFIFDSGSDTHVCNDHSRFSDYHQAPFGDEVRIGDTFAEIKGYGTVTVKPKGYGGEPCTFTLMEVAHIPGFHTNILSAERAEIAGIWWNPRLRRLENIDGKPLCEVQKMFGQNVIEYRPISKEERASFAVQKKTPRTKSDKPPKSVASLQTWHERLGHMSYEAIRRLPETTEGIRISVIDDTPEVCEACALSKITRQPSRASIRHAIAPFQTLHMDVVIMTEAYNSSTYYTHLHDEYSRWSFGEDHADKTQIRDIVFRTIDWIKGTYRMPVMKIHTDGETTLSDEFKADLRRRNIALDQTQANSPEMNPISERLGRLISERSRSELIASRMPRSLWPEVHRITLRKMNLIPFKQPDGSWKSPFEILASFLGRSNPKPWLANERIIGSRTYIRMLPSKKTDKMAPRALIGYMIGAISWNVYRVWMPQRQRVITVRDVIVDESQRYDPKNPFLLESIGIEEDLPRPKLQQMIGVEIQVHEIAEDEDSDEEEFRPPPIHHGRDMAPERPPTPQKEKALPVADDGGALFLTPDATPEPNWRGEVAESHDIDTTPHMPNESTVTECPIPHHRTTSSEPQGSGGRDSENNDNRSSSSLDPVAQQLLNEFVANSGYDERPVVNNQRLRNDYRSTIEQSTANDEGSVLPGSFINEDLDDIPQENAEGTGTEPQPHPSQEVRLNIDQGNIIPGKRQRKANNERRAIYLAQLEKHPDRMTTLRTAFQIGLMDRTKNQLHRSTLPNPPQNYREMLRHSYQKEWEKAMDVEMNGLRSKETFQEIPRQQDTKTLPLRWVYDYKFNEDGYLMKFKARICVRGDLQEMSFDDTRAATLAAKSFRTMMSITAQFDLETHQLDAVNAFLNSELDEIVYVELPDGYKQPGVVLRLNRALYGLRRSPRLWQKEFTKTMKDLGLQPVPEDPCLFTDDNLVAMVFVDDILFVYDKKRQHRFNQIATELKKQYEFRDEGEAEWYLGIRIIRDRSARKLWLCQDSYIEKIANRFDLTDRTARNTPISVESLTPNPDKASPNEIHAYQRRVGSIIYAAVITRPDVAFASSKLSEYLINPAIKHRDAADRVIIYLYSTRHYALEFGSSPDDEEIFLMASDAAFGDNIDRKSTAGYLCKLFGAAVDWKSGKQMTVTTSSTEAELLALADAGKHLFWWIRLFDTIHFEPECPIVIHCDNRQTIGLLTKEDAQMTTKLRHVDINRHWLREKVQDGIVKLEWTPTAQMPADGLTKVLPAQPHASFTRMIGLVQLPERILAGGVC